MAVTNQYVTITSVQLTRWLLMGFWLPCQCGCVVCACIVYVQLAVFHNVPVLVQNRNNRWIAWRKIAAMHLYWKGWHQIHPQFMHCRLMHCASRKLCLHIELVSVFCHILFAQMLFNFLILSFSWITSTFLKMSWLYACFDGQRWLELQACSKYNVSHNPAIFWFVLG